MAFIYIQFLWEYELNNLNKADADQWLMICMMHVIACRKLGEPYNPMSENNTAVNAVHLADSLIFAYKERFSSSEESSEGGSSGNGAPEAPAVAQSMADKIAATVSAENRLDKFSGGLIRGSDAFMPISVKALDSAKNTVSPSSARMKM